MGEAVDIAVGCAAHEVKSKKVKKEKMKKFLSDEGHHSGWGHAQEGQTESK